MTDLAVLNPEIEGLLRGFAAAGVEDELGHAAAIADELGLVGAHVVAHAVLGLAGRVAADERRPVELQGAERKGEGLRTVADLFNAGAMAYGMYGMTTPTLRVRPVTRLAAAVETT